MDPKNLILMISMIFFFLGFVRSSELEQDRSECSDQLVGLTTCLPYVGGNGKVPTKDCCEGFKHVLDTSKKCICLLIKDRNDPKLGVKINASLAVHLPTACHQSAPNISQCVSLLHLRPNSPEAKEFESLGKIEGNATTVSPSQGTSSARPTAESEKSDGGKIKKSWLGVDVMIYGALIMYCFHIVHLSSFIAVL